MRKLSVSHALITAALVVASAVQAAPRQIVLVVAEGANPATNELFSTYVQKTYEQDEVTGYAALKAQAKAPIGAADLPAFSGLLKTASASGYKTGIVTTGDVTKTAPIFYGLTGDDLARQIVDAKFDFVAGGGRAHFVPQGTPGSLRKDNTDLAKTLADAGGSALFTAEALTEEAKGKVLALQGDVELNYALDRDEEEVGLSDLVTQALDALGTDEAPFVLVVHDTLLAKALAAKDTPAAAEQFHELNGIVDSLLDRRDENPADFAVAVLSTGGTTLPRFTTNAANEQRDALFILSNLPLSFSKAGAALKGVNAEAIDEFAQEKYIGWKLSSANRAAILNGTLAPESVLRASYEPALRIEYVPATPQASAFAVGLPTAENLAQSLKSVLSAKPGKPTAPPA